MRKSPKYIVIMTAVFVFLAACGNAGAPPGGETETAGKKYKSTGIVRALDAEKKQITIDHRKIPNLMAAMTMDFPVAEKELLEAVAVGDRVEFELEKNGADLIVTNVRKLGEAAPEKVDAAGIYRANCAECHGEKGAGVEGKGISFLEGHALDHTEEDFIRQVKYGEEDEMPAFQDKLSEKEIKAVVRYVREEIQSEALRKEKGGGGHKH